MASLLGNIKSRLTGDPGQVTFERGKLVTFLNPYSYLVVRQDERVLDGFTHIFIDGKALQILLNLLGFRISKRVSFDYSSIAGQVLSEAVEAGRSVYVIGSTEVAITSFIGQLRRRYPAIRLSGWRHGYFGASDSRQDVILRIKTLDPDIVICGMGVGLQEHFLRDLRDCGWGGCGYTCGGFIHQVAEGSMDYYPGWINRLELRFLYRIYREPKLLKRYLFEYPKIIPALITDYIVWANKRP